MSLSVMRSLPAPVSLPVSLLLLLFILDPLLQPAVYGNVLPGGGLPSPSAFFLYFK